MNIAQTLGRAYKAEPAIINTAVALGVAVAAKFGFNIDADWIVASVFGGSAAIGTVVTRGIVYAPATVEDSTPKPDVPYGPLNTGLAK